MANVLEFHVELVGLEKTFWRDIQISDNSTIAKPGYVVMASFHGQACHLFNIKYEGKRYELLVEPDDFEGVLGPTFNPMKSKLRDFDFEPGNVLTMEYDYGAGWEWTIEYRNSFTLKKGAGKHYPYVTGDNIIDFDAQRKWKSIYPQDKDILLTNAFCINCHVGMFKPGYTIRGVSNGDIAIDGECAGCGNKICRVVDKNWFKLK